MVLLELEIIVKACKRLINVFHFSKINDPFSIARHSQTDSSTFKLFKSTNHNVLFQQLYFQII